MITKLRLTGRQYAALNAHLFPGDKKEAVAVALCGRGGDGVTQTLSVHKIVNLPYAACSIREPDRITWPVLHIEPLLEEAARKGLAVLKIHSHPGGYERFSPVDDRADRELFASVFGIADSDAPHASAIMLPDGSLFARRIEANLAFSPVELIAVAGDDLRFWRRDAGAEASGSAPEAFSAKNRQFFGEETFRSLRRLSVAVVGCSGTGSPTVEQLARLGVGRLILIDPDIVKDKNLNRILNTTRSDAERERFKVDVLAEAVRRMGLGTEVVVMATNLLSPNAMRAVAACDVVFGCMDGAEGRYYLNRLAAFYNVPYFDLGVRLDADGAGGVDYVCGSVHYLQPDGSSLLSRGVITMEDVRAEGMARLTPDEYHRQRNEGYIRNVDVERPAVISINMLVSALAVNEFIARLHPYRLVPNFEMAVRGVDLINNDAFHGAEGMACPSLAKHAGRGDMNPPLELPALCGQEEMP